MGPDEEAHFKLICEEQGGGMWVELLPIIERPGERLSHRLVLAQLWQACTRPSVVGVWQEKERQEAFLFLGVLLGVVVVPGGQGLGADGETLL